MIPKTTTEQTRPATERTVARGTDPKTDRWQFAIVMKWLTVISAAMFLIGLGVLLPAAIRRDRSTQWPATPGVIAASGLKTHLRKPNIETSFTPAISYSYAVDGIPRNGTRLDFADGRPAFRKNDGLQWLEKRYPVGKPVTVYYHPSNPDLAVLVPGARNLIENSCWWLATTAACAIFCFAIYRARTRLNP